MLDYTLDFKKVDNDLKDKEKVFNKIFEVIEAVKNNQTIIVNNSKDNCITNHIVAVLQYIIGECIINTDNVIVKPKEKRYRPLKSTEIQDVKYVRKNERLWKVEQIVYDYGITLICTYIEDLTKNTIIHTISVNYLVLFEEDFEYSKDGKIWFPCKVEI